MSFHKLDRSGKAIRGRSQRTPAVRRIRGVKHFRYVIRFDRPSVDGRRRQGKTTLWLPSDAAAEETERSLRGDVPADAMTWSIAWKAYREAHDAKRAPAHLDNMARDVRSLIELLGDLAIEQTTLADYTRFLAEREKSSGRAAQLARDHTRRVAKWAQQRGWVVDLPFYVAARPEYTPKVRQPATVGEFYAVAEALPEHLKHFWLCLGYTGCRLSALCGLQEADVGPTHLEVVTKRQKRIACALHAPTRRALDAARAYKGRNGIRSDFVFVNSRGNAWNRHTYRTALAYYAKEAGAPHVTPHQLRHLWGTLAASANFSPDMIQAGMGHESRASAEQYIHHTQRMADEVSTAVVRLLDQARAGTDRTHSDRPNDEPPPAGDRDRPQSPASVVCPHCGRKFNVPSE